MKAKVVLIILLFLAWGAGSVYWYVCKIKGLCVERYMDLHTEGTNEAGNLLFSFGDLTPETNARTSFTLDSIRELQFDTLVITGLSYIGEEVVIGSDRAQSIKNLIGFNDPKKPVKLLSKSVSDSLIGKTKAFELSVIIKPEDPAVADSDFSIERTQDKIIIYFPSASADPHTNSQLITELKKFSELVIQENSKIRLVGHTDNSGTHELNIKYGQLRADAIARLLVEFGVKKELIETRSRGESEPIASNDNEAGKRKNRRVEILILGN
ncbi:MAG: OmpA family protein [Bacteroidota bacterium]